MEVHKVISILVISIGTVICWTACLVIIAYLKNKSLGKQTILDKFVAEFVKAYSFYATLANILVYFMIFPLLPEFCARFMFYCSNFFFDNVLVWFITMVLIWYISIYHSILLEFHLSDSEVVKTAKMWVLFAIVVPIFALEHLGLNKLNNYTVYLLLAGKNVDQGTGLPLTTKILGAIATCSVILLQIKIEKDRNLFLNHAPFLRRFADALANFDDTNVDGNYGKNATRVIAVMATYCVSYSIVATFVVSEDSKFMLGMASIISVSVVPPVMFIVASKKITQFAMRSLLGAREKMYECFI